MTWSFSLAIGDVGVFLSEAIVECRAVMAIGSTFGAILVKQTGNTLAVALPTSPIVALYRVLQGGFLLGRCLFQVLNAHGHLTNHELVLTKDQVCVMTTVSGLGN